MTPWVNGETGLPPSLDPPMSQEVKGRMAKNALASGTVGENTKLRVEDLMQFFK